MNIEKKDIFTHHMKNMLAHYQSDAIHTYSLPLELLHTQEEVNLLGTAEGFTTNNDTTELTAKLILLFNKSQTTLTDAYMNIQSKAGALVTKFGKDNDTNKLVDGLKNQKQGAKENLNNALNKIFNDLMEYGTTHEEAQTSLLKAADEIGILNKKLLDNMGDYFTELAQNIRAIKITSEAEESSWVSLGRFFTNVASQIGKLFKKLGAAAEHVYNTIAKSAQQSWEAIKILTERALNNGLNTKLEEKARQIEKTLDKNKLKEEFNIISKSHQNELDTLDSSLKYKQLTPEAQHSLKSISNSLKSTPHLHSNLKATPEDKTGWVGVQLEGTAGILVGVTGAIGGAIGLRGGEQITDNHIVGYAGYAAFEAYAGVAAGLAGGMSLITFASEKEELTGPFYSVCIGVVDGAGLIIKAYWSREGLILDKDPIGFSVAVMGGGFVGLAVAAGYRFSINT